MWFDGILAKKEPCKSFTLHGLALFCAAGVLHAGAALRGTALQRRVADRTTTHAALLMGFGAAIYNDGLLVGFSPTGA